MAIVKIAVTPSLHILESDLGEKFIHSGGPGGQNVNKVATGVQLRYNPRQAGTLPEAVIARAERLAGSRMTQDGDILIQSTRYRSQEKNREDARQRLIDLLADAAKPPPPKRRPTRPTLGSRKRRLESKIKRGSIKKLRGRPDMD